MSTGFWARKLGALPSAPAPSPPWLMGDGTASAPATATPPALPHGDPSVAGHDFRRARHLKNSGACPDCGSGNYFPVGKKTGVNGSVEVIRCFDCGWPVEHTTKGMARVTEEAHVARARQVAGGGGIIHNYHPQDTRAGSLMKPSDLR